MSDQLPDFSDFVAATNNPERLMKVYSEWLDGIFSAPLWSPSTQEGFRIPWRSFVDARNLDKETFNKPGLYLFGAMGSGPGQDVPRYIGETHADTLWIRIKGRYIPGPIKRLTPYKGDYKRTGLPTQCEIAEYHEADLKKSGWKALPSWLQERYRKNHPSMIRLRYAEDFARHDIKGIWVAILAAPVGTASEIISPLEGNIINVARKWNCKRGFQCLVNTEPQHNCRNPVGAPTARSS